MAAERRQHPWGSKERREQRKANQEQTLQGIGASGSQADLEKPTPTGKHDVSRGQPTCVLLFHGFHSQVSGHPREGGSWDVRTRNSERPTRPPKGDTDYLGPRGDCMEVFWTWEY